MFLHDMRMGPIRQERIGASKPRLGTVLDAEWIEWASSTKLEENACTKRHVSALAQSEPVLRIEKIDVRAVEQVCHAKVTSSSELASTRL